MLHALKYILGMRREGGSNDGGGRRVRRERRSLFEVMSQEEVRRKRQKMQRAKLIATRRRVNVDACVGFDSDCSLQRRLTLPPI